MKCTPPFEVDVMVAETGAKWNKANVCDVGCHDIHAKEKKGFYRFYRMLSSEILFKAKTELCDILGI